MINLYHFGPIWELPDASPFCMRLETYLRMARVPYESVRVNAPRRGPKGKCPYIEDTARGVRMGDSGLIIAYLKQTYGDPLDANMTTADKAVAHTFDRMLNEHLYWTVLYSRWFDDRNWPVVSRTFFSALPPMLKNIVPKLVRKKMFNQLYGQGLGRHTQEEIYQLGKNDIAAASHFLGDKPFFMGVEPTSIDATVYAYIANILIPPLDSPLKAHAQSLPNLQAYCDRMKRRYY